MAAAGADAIEVWNEPNIDREWPNGQSQRRELHAVARQSLQRDQGGQPRHDGDQRRPGADRLLGRGGCAADGCNDDVFLQQMAAAGAANYMDCIGAHHNCGHDVAVGLIRPTRKAITTGGTSCRR